MPQVGLTTDLIVGFPGETEADFERTLYALDAVRFHQVYPFKYSPRPGTPATAMDDDVPREVKEERLARVIETCDAINRDKMREYEGTVQEVLIDGAHTKRRGVMNGRTDANRPISIKDPDLEIGDIVRARVTGHQGYWLEGEILSGERVGVGC